MAASAATNLLLVPAHPASSALQALKAPFTHAGVDALVVGRGSRIEVYALEPAGLALALEIELHASVVSIASFVPSGATTASLVVLTAAPTWKLIVLRHDPSSPTGVRTEASESLYERAARPAEGVQTVAVDPYGRCIVVLAYDGLLRVFPLVSSPTHRRRSSSARGALKATPLDLSRSYNVRMSMLNVHQLAFLSLGDAVPPTLGILHTDHQGQKVLRIRAIDMAEKELVTGSAPANDFVVTDPGSELFIPVPAPGPGVIVVGEEEATFIALSDPAPGPLESPKGKGRASKATRPSCRLPIGVYSAFCAVDDDPSRFLVADIYGTLHVFTIERKGERVSGIEVDDVGKTSSAMALVYLANSFVFVASHYGDSQLCRLPPVIGGSSRAERDGSMDVDGEDEVGLSKLEVIHAFTNLGPISDFCVVDPEGLGQSQVVTCSGAYGDGSIRVVRHGVGLTNLASLDMGSVLRAWPLRERPECVAGERRAI